MRWRVDPPIRTGGVVCAAISDVAVSLRGEADAVSGSARKDALCVVVVRDGVASGHTPGGEVLDAEALEARFPGAVAGIMAQSADPT